MKTVEKVEGSKLGFEDGFAWEVTYRSAVDLVRDCRDAVQTHPQNVHFDITDSGFTGRKFRDWDELVAAVSGTWREGIERVEDMARELEKEELPRPTVVRRKRVWSEFSGDEVCVDRYRHGEPFLRDQTRLAVSGPRVITILTQFNGSAYVSARDMFWRGALSVALARIIEDAGYRAEITIINQASQVYPSHNVQHAAVSCNIKGAGDALDIGMVANVTSGWFFRTCGFGSYLAPRKQVSSGQGRYKAATPEFIERVAPGVKPWVVSKVFDKISALKLARELLATLVN